MKNIHREYRKRGRRGGGTGVPLTQIGDLPREKKEEL